MRRYQLICRVSRDAAANRFQTALSLMCLSQIFHHQRCQWSRTLSRRMIWLSALWSCSLSERKTKSLLEWSTSSSIGSLNKTYYSIEKLYPFKSASTQTPISLYLPAFLIQEIMWRSSTKYIRYTKSSRWTAKSYLWWSLWQRLALFRKDRSRARTAWRHRIVPLDRTILQNLSLTTMI